MASIQELLGSDIYFNEKMAKIYSMPLTQPNPTITLLRTDIAEFSFNKTPLPGSDLELTSRAKIDFEDVPNKLNLMGQTLGINTKGMSFDDYLDIGEKVISEDLGIKDYYRFSRRRVMSYLDLTDEQLATFTTSSLRNLAIGNLAESAMRNILLSKGIKSKARGFLFHNLDEAQEEKDIKVYLNASLAVGTGIPLVPQKNTLDLGVKVHESFQQNYLYYKNRVRNNNNGNNLAIADHVAFFNHFGYHIFYLTGIVQRDFLTKQSMIINKSPMEEFCIPESCNTLDYSSVVHMPLMKFCEGYDCRTLLDQQKMELVFSKVDEEKLRNQFKKRINPQEYFDLLAKMPKK